MRRLLVVVVAVAACSSSGSSGSSGSSEPRPRERPAPDSSAPVATATTASPLAFDGAVAPADPARLSHSWRPGCPVAPDVLRLLTLDHWGYDGAEHRGELVVHADHAEAALGVFRVLYEARFPVEKIELVDAYGGDDAASTRANNTSGFNCRSVVGRPGVWSQHAYGLAIDLNPLVNPYTLDPHLGDPALAPYLDRSLDVPGLLRGGDPAVVAFEAIGWQWGGYWASPDYQHFSATGR